MNWFFKAKIPRFCVANLVNSGLFPAIYALNRAIFSLENFNPDLIRGFLTLKKFFNSDGFWCLMLMAEDFHALCKREMSGDIL